MRNKDKLDFINQIVKEAEKQCDIHVVSKSFFCQHKLVLDCKEQCWKCRKIANEH